MSNNRLEKDLRPARFARYRTEGLGAFGGRPELEERLSERRPTMPCSGQSKAALRLLSPAVEGE
jgi:hypothetical protein